METDVANHLESPKIQRSVCLTLPDIIIYSIRFDFELYREREHSKYEISGPNGQTFGSRNRTHIAFLMLFSFICSLYEVGTTSPSSL